MIGRLGFSSAPTIKTLPFALICFPYALEATVDTAHDPDLTCKSPFIRTLLMRVYP